MTAPPKPAATAMISVYAGQRCIGFVIARGKDGHEAFTAAELSLGVYRTMKLAANAVSRAVL
jgi:hypothetical protein